MNAKLDFDFIYHPVADGQDSYLCDCCREQFSSDLSLFEIRHERFSSVCENCKDMIEIEAKEEEDERHERLRRCVAINSTKE
jgi:hypothetical protein